jgi:hypothetical protein
MQDLPVRSPGLSAAPLSSEWARSCDGDSPKGTIVPFVIIRVIPSRQLPFDRSLEMIRTTRRTSRLTLGPSRHWWYGDFAPGIQESPSKTQRHQRGPKPSTDRYQGWASRAAEPRLPNFRVERDQARAPSDVSEKTSGRYRATLRKAGFTASGTVCEWLVTRQERSMAR